MNEHARSAFAEVLGDGDQTALLLGADGTVRAGVYLDSQGNDVTPEIGRALAGVGSEAHHAMRHLALGDWRAIVCECTDANIAFAPGDCAGELVLVATAPDVPSGFVRRLLDIASERARIWRSEVA